MDIMSEAHAALNPRRIVPAHKADYQAVHNLRRVGEDRIMAELTDLLEWTQDGNWPVARGVGEVLAQHYPAIRPAVLSILRGPDAQWKYFLMGLVVMPVLQARPDEELLRELRRIAQQPTPAEQHDEADRQARYVLGELGL
jgi:hypothetical protein